jgi:hypothetical protein
MPEKKTETSTTPKPAAPSPVDAAVDTWASDLLRNLGPALSTESYNHLHSAIGALKTRLAAIEKEG